jgi:hypothetical protein
MGSDLLQLDTNIASYIKGRIVIIGDYTDKDIHDTYFGPIAGCLINYNAVIALQQENYIINWSSICFLFVIYFMVSLLLTMGVSLRIRIEKVWENVLLHVILSFVGIWVFWLVLELIAYYLLNVNLAVFVPSIYFAFYSGILSIRDNIKQFKKQTEQ